MEKIPDYRIREEDVRNILIFYAKKLLYNCLLHIMLCCQGAETEAQLVQVSERLREHRLRKAELYRQQAGLGRADSELPPPAPDTAVNLSQTCHDRAHTESVPLCQEEDHRPEPSQDGRSTRQSQGAPGGGGGASTIVPPPPYQFSDPCPGSMRHVRIAELSSVDINWKMLTLARPTSKIDEDIFSK